MVKVLFVCLGNICRSPASEGIFHAMVTKAGLSDVIDIDSAGTGAWHVGDPPDPRGQAAAVRRGYDLSGQRARKVTISDFEQFDYIIGMDSSNYADLAAIAPEASRDKIKLFLDFAPNLSIRDVPDPYYGGPEGFENVLDLLEEASKGLLDEIRHRHFESQATSQ